MIAILHAIVFCTSDHVENDVSSRSCGILYAFAEKTTIKMNFAYNGLWIECHFVENENQPRTFSFSISVVMVKEFFSEVSGIHYKFMEK